MRRSPRRQTKLRPVPVMFLTGFERDWRQIIPAVKGKHCVVGELSVGGAAPKDFLRVYEYGAGRRDKPRTWPRYIAKVGHKRYPSESITEQLFTRIGQVLGFRMAESRLMYVAGQIRFLSRYFLKRNQVLAHGAQIFSGYLEDPAFVEQVRKEERVADVFTFQVIVAAIRAVFPDRQAEILRDYVRLLAFDGLVGNNDRHIYNWAVVDHALGNRAPYFSPIYDTARGLFWNVPETGLPKYEGAMALARYVEAARPQVGWDGKPNLNHFELLGRIAAEFPEFLPVLREWGDGGAMGRVYKMLHTEFADLLSRSRRELIQACLELRAKRYREVVQ